MRTDLLKDIWTGWVALLNEGLTFFRRIQLLNELVKMVKNRLGRCFLSITAYDARLCIFYMLLLRNHAIECVLNNSSNHLI